LTEESFITKSWGRVIYFGDVIVEVTVFRPLSSSVHPKEQNINNFFNLFCMVLKLFPYFEIKINVTTILTNIS
jgi:hypothetical protein